MSHPQIHPHSPHLTSKSNMNYISDDNESLQNETADENYNVIQKAQEELKALQARLSNIKAKCWAVYVHDEYETYYGNQGTQLFYITDTKTELEAREYVEKHRDITRDYVIIPATKNGNGLITDCKGYNITKKISCYTGPCKVLFASVDWFIEDRYEGDIPKREWLNASDLSCRIECESAVISIESYFDTDDYPEGKKYFLVNSK